MFWGIVAYWLESMAKRPCLSCVTDIHANLPISKFSSKNSVIFIWVTTAFLATALDMKRKPSIMPYNRHELGVACFP